jgi:hypothetical protein
MAKNPNQAPSAARMILPAGRLHRHNHEQAGQQPADEQIADRQIHQKTVNDEDDAGRDDDADGAAGGHRGRGKMFVVAALGHLGIHDRADGRRGRRVGAGDRRKQTAGPERGHGEPATHPAENRVGEIGQSLGDPRRIDQIAGQDKQRQRQQTIEVKPLVQSHPDIGQREVNHKADADHPEADDEEDRHAEDEQSRYADGDENNEKPVHDPAPLYSPSIEV